MRPSPSLQLSAGKKRRIVRHGACACLKRVPAFVTLIRIMYLPPLSYFLGDAHVILGCWSIIFFIVIFQMLGHFAVLPVCTTRSPHRNNVDNHFFRWQVLLHLWRMLLTW